MLLSSFMQEFGPISSRVHCIFAQITNNKFVVELSTRNLCGKKYNTHETETNIVNELYCTFIESLRSHD
jgi:hypothetical protein